MSNSFFYMSAEKNDLNRQLTDEIQEFALSDLTQTYVIDRPLGDQKYSYAYDRCLVVLIPKHKILFINLDESSEEEFEDFCDEFIEDLGSIADKYRYKEFIGRPKTWRKLTSRVLVEPEDPEIMELLHENSIDNAKDQRTVELLISLLTGSINDIEKVGENIPDNILDKVKKKILLFDGDQTRFIYQNTEKATIRIQGLSGTGKTELLLHKIKELYTSPNNYKIFFTCHNKILADNLRKRIPDFFNFLKVEQQIRWDERLWCTNAWGSRSDKNSGAYSYICHSYGLTFHPLSSMRFEEACKYALK